MEIVVCIKQVPATTRVQLNPRTRTIIREGVELMLNPFDAYALEEALRLRELHGGRVSVMTMGIPSAEMILRESLAMGADQAILLTDRRFAGADTLATATTLAAAIRKCGAVDLILCGRQAIDGDTAQVGPELAEKLDIPHITAVAKIEEVNAGNLTCQKMVDEGYAHLRVQLPALLTVVKEINTPRFPTLAGFRRAQKSDILIWNAEDLEVDVGHIGLEGSPTQVIATFVPEQYKTSRLVEGTLPEIASHILGSVQQQAGWKQYD
jgi:electron transfer flavoprotein beta subunit